MVYLISFQEALYPALMFIIAGGGFMLNIRVAKRNNEKFIKDNERFIQDKFDKKLDKDDFQVYKEDHEKDHKDMKENQTYLFDKFVEHVDTRFNDIKDLIRANK